jgi:hypothetical protein
MIKKFKDYVNNLNVNRLCKKEVKKYYEIID